MTGLFLLIPFTVYFYRQPEYISPFYQFIIFTLPLIFTGSFFCKNQKNETLFFQKIHRSYIVFFMGLLLTIQICYYLSEEISRFKTFYKATRTLTTIFDVYYENVQSNDFKFPDKKQNLIILCLESTDNSFSERSVFGENLVPQMTEIRKNNIAFTGYKPVSGTTWTAAALTGILYGIPLLSVKAGISISNTTRNVTSSFFDIFLAHGYNVIFLQGSDIYFAGKNKLFTNHPDLTILDIAVLRNNKKYSPFLTKENNGWGFPDHVLFKIAKNMLLERKVEDKPFCLFILTADTHGFNGYVSPHIKRRYNDYRDAICQQDKMVADFITDIKQLPVNRNTTIMIIGDHLCPKVALPNEITTKQKNYFRREIYACLINPVLKDKQNPIRKNYGIFDLPATILESIGATWQSRKFGIGVSLFAEQNGLLDIYSPEEFNKIIFGFSPEYTKTHLEK